MLKSFILWKRTEKIYKEEKENEDKCEVGWNVLVSIKFIQP